MSTNTLLDQYIDDTFPGVLHASGAELPATGQQAIYDGAGNKTSISIGREGQGFKVGVLEYPFENSTIGAQMVQTGLNKLELKTQDNIYKELINHLYPVNSIFLSLDNVNPGIRFLNTTWTQISQGRFLVGVGTGNDGIQSKSINSGDVYGEYDHTLSEGELPLHGHAIPTVIGNQPIGSPGFRYDHYQDDSGDSVLNTQFPGSSGPTGKNQPHNNTPPGYGLYVWKRTS